MPPSCALLGGFAIGARVALLWQDYGNAWQSPAVIRRAHRTPHACHTRRRREMYCSHARLCVSVCLSVRGRMPTLLHGPGCNLGEW